MSVHCDDMHARRGDQAQAASSRTAWTFAEKKQLRQMAPTHNAAQIGKVLGRTTHAVRQQAHLQKVRLQKAGDRNARTKYSDSLVEAIRSMHEGGKGPTQIARETGVPIGNVKAFVYFSNRASSSRVLLLGCPKTGSRV